jgi:ankyrin repeat protein
MPKSDAPRQKTKPDRLLLKSFAESYRGELFLNTEQALRALEMGADFTLKLSSNGLSAFLNACLLSNAAGVVAAMAARGGVAELRDSLGRTGLHLAASCGHLDALPALSAAIGLETRDDGGETPLGSAIRARRWDAALALVKLGADLLAEDNAGSSCLLSAQRLYASLKDFETLGAEPLSELLDIGFAQVERREIMSPLAGDAEKAEGSAGMDPGSPGTAQAPAASRRARL